jgi:alpha-glucosidase
MSTLQPHHDGSPLYVSSRSPAVGETVRVRLRVPDAFGPVASVHVRSNPDREPRFDVAAIIGAAGGWTWWEAHVEVENPVHGYRWLLVDDVGGQHWLNARGLFRTETPDIEDFRLVADADRPEWADDAVLYQVFPDRFARSTAADSRETPEWAIPASWNDHVENTYPGRSKQFYGGDLDGVREHLDHLVDLGVTLLYLTPIFPGRSNHRYDATTFDAVDPLLGGEAALARLIEAAHERGIRVLGDLTSNHTGDAHEWFTTALADRGSTEAGFYYWSDAGHGYASWLGVPSLPKLNWASPELRRRFIEGADSVVGRWLAFGLDGWRIDVANMTGRYLADDFNAEVRRTIRATMREVNPDTLLLGESTNDAAVDFQGDAWHGAMTYAGFTRPLWSWLLPAGSSAGGGLGFALGQVPHFTGRQFVDAHTRFTAAFPWATRVATMNALDTHDTPRFATDADVSVIPVAFGMAISLPGIPVVWAGDEFGLAGVDGEASRTPMPWASVGSTDVAERTDLYRSLIALRHAHPVLASGGMRWLHVDDEVLVYIRESGDESVLCVAARGDVDVLLPTDAVAGVSDAVSLFGSVTLEASGAGVALRG